MSAKSFNFVERYRALDSTAAREIVTAREEAHKAIKPKTNTMPRIRDLCRLAFHLPFEAELYNDWFSEPARQFDNHFILAHDVAEAGRIATLILQDYVSGGSYSVALMVLSASFAGTRPAFDGGKLLSEARDLIASSANVRALDSSPEKIVYPKNKDLDEAFTAFDSGVNTGNTKAAFSLLREEAIDAVSKINTAYEKLRKDSIRVADEIDMLWFYVGDWSGALDKPRNAVHEKALPISIGVDLGVLVRQLPGPFGLYGIITRSLGKNYDKTISAADSISQLSQSELSNLKPGKAIDVFPVHKAMEAAAAGGDWKVHLKGEMPEIFEAKLTYADLAKQIYWERVSMVYAGL